TLPALWSAEGPLATSQVGHNTIRAAAAQLETDGLAKRVEVSRRKHLWFACVSDATGPLDTHESNGASRSGGASVSNAAVPSGQTAALGATHTLAPPELAATTAEEEIDDC